MSGMIYKDLMLLKTQWKFFISFVAIAIIMQATMENSDFVLGYLTICGSMMVLNTISYDEYDNGNAFLFSLPVSRKSYVLEKYAFAFLTGGAAWLVAVISEVIFNAIKAEASVNEILISAPAYLIVLTLVLSLVLPLRLKFGGEKLMFVYIGIGGGAMIIGFLLKWLGFDFSRAVKFLSGIGIWGVLAGLAVIAAIVLALSYKISQIIMSRKEF